MRSPFPRCSNVFVIALMASALAATPLAAQDAWEYSPYQVKIWVAALEGIEMGRAFEARLADEIAQRCEALIHAPWSAEVSSAPEEYRTELLDRIESIPPLVLIKHSRDIALADKLFLVGVSDSGDGFRIQVRELDCRSREFGNVVERSIGDVTQVGHAAFATMLDAFRPIARIESTKEIDRKVNLKIRAAGLVTRQDSPVLIPIGSVLQPYMRHNDRTGEPNIKVGIQKVPWTYCLTLSRDDFVITCQIHSGTRVPVAGKPSQRIQRFAVMIPIRGGSTTIALQSLAKRSEPLSGYDIYAKDPLTDKQELIGRTDWRGTMEIPSSENPLRLVYVRNGTQLLARLPILPGWESLRTVQISSDDQRLHVEGMLKGVQSRIMDMLAHRTLAKARFKKRMEEGKLPEAKKLLDEFMSIDTRDSVDRTLNIEQARNVSQIETVKLRIAKLFDQTRGLLTKHINPDEGSQLAAEYDERKANAPPEASTPSSPPTRQPGS